MSSAIQSLVFAAKRNGVELSFDRIMLASALKESQEPDAQTLCKIARHNGLNAKQVSASWNDLFRIGTASPVIAQLKNKHYVVIVGFSKNDGDDHLLILDPTSKSSKPVKVSRDKFCKAWSRRLIFLKKPLEDQDAEKNFSLKWLIGQYFSERALVAKTVVVALLFHCLALLPIFYIMILLDKVINFQSESTLIILTFALALTYITGSILEFIKGYIQSFYRAKIETRVHRMQLDGLLSKPLDFFKAHNEKEIVELTSKASSLQNTVLTRIFESVSDFVAILIYAPILLLFSPELFAIAAIFALLMILINRRAWFFKRDVIEQRNQLASKQTTILQDSVYHIESIKLLSRETNINKDWESYSSIATMRRLESDKIGIIYSLLYNTLDKLSLLAVLFVGSLLILNAQLSLGVMLACYFLAKQISTPLSRLSTLKLEYQHANELAQKIGDIINTKEPENSQSISQILDGDIEFRNVSFSYTKKQMLLSHLNFKVRSGQTIAIFDQNGNASSALLKLISGIISPSKGSIFIDDVELSAINSDHRSSNIGIVDALFPLLSETIRGNITGNNPHISRERLHEVLRSADLLEDLPHLPEGLDTNIANGNFLLPKSMHFKINLARALIKNPKILLINDPVSQLTLDEEIQFLRNLPHISKNRTVLVGLRRINQAMNCNSVIVLGKSGSILEDGAPTELASKSSWYSKQKEAYARYAKPMAPDLDQSGNKQEPLEESSKTDTPHSDKLADLNDTIHDQTVANAVADTFDSSSVNLLDNSSDHSSDHTETSEAVIADAQISTTPPEEQDHSTLKQEDKPSTGTERTKSINSLKLKELGERLHRNNLQAQEARQKADRKLEEVKRSHSDTAKPSEPSSVSSQTISTTGQTIGTYDQTIGTYDQTIGTPGQTISPSAQTVEAPSQAINTSDPEISKENRPEKEENNDTPVTSQEKTLTSFIEGYLKND